MYRKLHVKIKVPVVGGFVLSEIMIPVRKGIRQASITSPPLYNNGVLEAQSYTISSCIYRGLDVSVLNYANDVINISRSVPPIEENFNILKVYYAKIGLSFNTSKSVLHVADPKSNHDFSYEGKFGDEVISSSKSMTYLGLPIGHNMKTTREGLIGNFVEKA